jgi:tRNA1Val (adenine37-N6)-methyltransferase
MPNQFFEFKTFKIWQQKAAMKVTTEACLFGAWANEHIKKIKPATILDIGTGTGLLSILIAQQNECTIDAVEIDEAAYKQAVENITANNVQHKVKATHNNIISFAANSCTLYDYIISNPPFYQQQLQSQKPQRNNALHDSSLNFLQLFIAAKKLLNSNGFFCILIPYYRLQETIDIALQHNLDAVHICSIKQTENHTYFRAMIVFSNVQEFCIKDDIIIKEGNKYSSAFVKLLQPFYLHL